MVSGAASCFYAFVGFDVVAVSGEESSNPTKHVPIAIVSTLVICLVAYVGVSSVLTLLVPWNRLDAAAALPNAFAQVRFFLPRNFFLDFLPRNGAFCIHSEAFIGQFAIRGVSTSWTGLTCQS